MIILSITCRAVPGHEADLEAVASELMRTSADHPGFVAYHWNRDSASDGYVVTEVFEDSESFLNHIRSSDFSALRPVLVNTGIRLFGDEPTDEMRQVLLGFGAVTEYPPIAPH